ncbi:unnamed protein product [Bursaphelenchus xylophilus]|uniref:protein-tyrosine-phosphatase n=3 Tax=Bursaphelenchus xylophilus TaxID=6326 RepID=A0A7I8WH12_BURXY|nr:unnamed protein product [Bursaphelenchus xylophilus]CAG9110300.1 unnamed protein product [Bursaphelenchus xylophilus]
MLRLGSGVYNLRDSEGPGVRPQLTGAEITCSIFFLDDSEHKFFVSKNATGQELMQKVFEFLELTEHDFFGLQFVCVTGSNTVRLKWLDTKKSIKRQMMCPPYHLFFRLKFYVSDPGKLLEEYTRYLVYLQLRKDLLDGRLPCTEDMAIILGGLAAQSELGDFNEEEHGEDYLNNFRLLPAQTKLLNKKICESHRSNKGLYPAEAEFEFLNKAKCLDFYGFDLYEARDGYERPITIGVNSNGVSVFDNGSRVHSFPWATIIKVSFKRKNFLLHIMMTKDNEEQSDTELSFNALTSQNCKMLWKSCIEHHTFFRLAVPPSTSAKSVFHLGSRFRYSGRTEHQTLEESKRVAKPDRQFQRVPLASCLSGDLKENNGDLVDSEALYRTEKTPLTHSTTSGSSIPNSQSSTTDITTGQPLRRSRRMVESVRRRTSSLIRDNIRRRLTQMGEISSSASSILQSFLAMSQNSFKPGDDKVHQRPDEEIFIDLDKEICKNGQTDGPAEDSADGRGSVEASPPVPPDPEAKAPLLQPVRTGDLNLDIKDNIEEEALPNEHQNGLIDAEESLRAASADAIDTEDSIRPQKRYSVIVSTPNLSNRRRENDPLTTSLQSLGLDEFDVTDDESKSQGSKSFVLKKERNQKTPSPANFENKVDGKRRSKVYSNSDDEGMIWHQAVQWTDKEASTSTNPPDHLHQRPRIRNNSTHQNGTPKQHVDHLKNNNPMQHSFVNNNLFLNRPPLPVGRENGSLRRTIQMNETEFPIVHPTSYGFEQRRSITQLPHDPHSQNRVKTMASPQIQVRRQRPSTAIRAPSPQLSHRLQRPASISPPTSSNGDDSSVVIRMNPDSHGRFGFNVTGGADCAHPVIISRIIPGSPAERCYPRLNEGDQVLKINDQDISKWSYCNVVNYIRSVRSFGEMSMTIKPNVYRYGELDDSENQNIIPETPHVSETVPRSDKLAHSLMLLKESLETGVIKKQFEKLYRKKVGLAMDESQTSNNIRKNRYQDVRPYDETRVILEKAPSGDYINASHVNMEILSTGIVNRYIATQGPLPHTSGDFWYMVWEQCSTTIVMLTTTVENGRIKCHQYWPQKKETLEFGQLVITNLGERSDRYCFYRELSVKNKLTREERRVTQMQYTAWPDHGVPENQKHFIDFVGEVRRARNGSLDPIIVHCSAGIGRTGVLILMETAACLIESNEPVYPLDIVKVMRDQRAMLIQTTEQYTFVCECILRSYSDGMLKPLAEYQKR